MRPASQRQYSTNELEESSFQLSSESGESSESVLSSTNELAQAILIVQAAARRRAARRWSSAKRQELLEAVQAAEATVAQALASIAEVEQVAACRIQIAWRLKSLRSIACPAHPPRQHTSERVTVLTGAADRKQRAALALRMAESHFGPIWV